MEYFPLRMDHETHDASFFFWQKELHHYACGKEYIISFYDTHSDKQNYACKMISKKQNKTMLLVCIYIYMWWKWAKGCRMTRLFFILPYIMIRTNHVLRNVKKESGVAIVIDIILEMDLFFQIVPEKRKK